MHPRQVDAADRLAKEIVKLLPENYEPIVLLEALAIVTASTMVHVMTPERMALDHLQTILYHISKIRGK